MLEFFRRRIADPVNSGICRDYCIDPGIKLSLPVDGLLSLRTGSEKDRDEQKEHHRDYSKYDKTGLAPAHDQPSFLDTKGLTPAITFPAKSSLSDTTMASMLSR